MRLYARKWGTYHPKVASVGREAAAHPLDMSVMRREARPGAGAK